MNSNVYFKKINSSTQVNTIQEITKQLLDTIIEKENISLEKKIPLKVHFGERKNVTFVKAENYLGIIEYLKERKIESYYIETSVLYGGERYKKELHEKTAEAHGFTQLPIIFADGEHGENFAEVEINKKHFKTFKIGRSFLDFDQLIVISHFKGHILAGFGGAIKQLSMGFAAKGGKMAMHMGEKPHIISKKCKQCNICKTRCNVDALIIEERSRIDHNKCVGCGACMAICPYNAISIITVKNIIKFMGIGNPFIEKLVEGAYAAQKDKKNIYINFAMNITTGCDCEPKIMKPIMDDFGIFISLDPVAIDKACYDIAKEKGKKFRGSKAFTYAEKIGLGSPSYTLHEIN
ncbi:MAG: DUF362 domain-containing protein [Candidatus Omnitrophica bacterium]|nr:DUF362 domain-containing protein [Candidatus Omnitrophota bacterium]